jgi:adenylate cyclase
MPWSGSSALVVRGGLTALLVTVLVVSGRLEWIELRALDGLFHVRGPRAPRAPVVIVAVDEDSFDELDLTWPWPRALHGQLVERLAEARPAVIGVDILFPEPSAHGPDDDEQLAQALGRAGNVVLAAAQTVVRDAAFTKEDLNLPLPRLRERAAGVGVTNLPPDPDAFVRRGLLGVQHQGETIASLDRLLYEAAVRAGVPGAPLPAGTSLVINYRGGPGTFPTVPFHRVLRGDVDDATFQGKIVLVGATSPTLHDVFPTPFAPYGTMPGVEIHANVLETLLGGVAVHRAPRWLVVGLGLLGAFFAAWVASRARPLPALGAVAAVVAVAGGAALAAFVWRGWWVDLVPLPLALVLGYGVAIVGRFMEAQRERQRLMRFFSPGVLREVMRQGHELGRSRRLVTVLFSDIRGFTPISERLSPEEVAEFLREYMTSMTEAVFRHGGTVTQFVGDEIVALYNAPFDQPDHAVQAVRTGLEFQERVRALSARWEARCGSPVHSGVGINTGEAVVGIIGSEQRVEYGAIGDTINLGSRLEGLTKTFGTPIIISERTYEALGGQFACRFLGEVSVKGKGIPVRIYAVEGAGHSRAERVAVDLPLTITDVSQDLYVSVTASLSDLSLTGLRATGARRRFAEGEVVGLRFEVPGLDRPITTEGRVMWAADNQVGIRFLALAEGDAERLGAFLKSRSAPARP